jgi:hypothetical protein
MLLLICLFNFFISQAQETDLEIKTQFISIFDNLTESNILINDNIFNDIRRSTHL